MGAGILIARLHGAGAALAGNFINPASRARRPVAGTAGSREAGFFGIAFWWRGGGLPGWQATKNPARAGLFDFADGVGAP